MKFVDVIIDNKTDQTDMLYTYACTEETLGEDYKKLEVGRKVHLPFGKGNTKKEAYIYKISEEPKEKLKGIKYIEKVDDEFSLNAEMMETAFFMRRRYFCKTIDAIKCFVPQGQISKRGKKRIPYSEEKIERRESPALTEEQKNVLSAIERPIEEKRHEIFLLHGVTGSGKTEVYMRAISKALELQKTAIMLVPEISLTKQIIERFFERFGRENIAILHSKLGAGERYDEWTRIKNGEVKIVIGARSAIFAPLEDIGLVIMDEEHETSYKSDMSPKYDTVEIAIKRLKAYNGVLLLGSATPSIVSYSRAKEGIYTLLTMKERYNKVMLPSVQKIDMRQELLAGNKTMFSKSLFEAISKNLSEKKQIILFLNRRGYSTFVSCRECGYVIRCAECGISMTYHKEQDKAICHYCGKSVQIPKLCPECGSKYIKHFGAGTEKVEESIKELFQEANVDRFDLDTIKRKGSIERILNDFKKGKTDILIGTQLVAKGLDFQNVGLVGIISADVSLNIPDFRSAERTFQLITQAAGRAGRGEERGNVIIQTYTPSHYAIEYAKRQDYEGFFGEEVKMRSLMKYPPYSDLAQLLFVSKEEAMAMRAAEEAKAFMNKTVPKEFLGNIFEPQKSPLNKDNGKYRYQIMIKIPKGQRMLYARIIDNLKKYILNTKNKDYNMIVDINPFSFM